MTDHNLQFQEEFYDDLNASETGISAEELINRKEYTTDELLREFKVIGFSHGFCAVERISDGLKGSFDFGYRPRRYFNFKTAD